MRPLETCTVWPYFDCLGNKNKGVSCLRTEQLRDEPIGETRSESYTFQQHLEYDLVSIGSVWH